MNFEPNKILEQGQNKWVPAERATIEEMTLVARGDPTTNRSHRIHESLPKERYFCVAELGTD